MRSDLARRLADHEPADKTEAESLVAVRRLLAVPDAFSSAFFVPGHVTASAFVVHPTHDSVALLLHSKIGRWLQPGGHVEPEDESVVAAALREVAEEIGVGAADEPWLCDVDVHVFPARVDVPQHLHHDVRFAFTADTPRLLVGDGAEDVRWWPFTEALELEPSVARPVRKLAEWRQDRN